MSPGLIARLRVTVTLRARGIQQTVQISRAMTMGIVPLPLARGFKLAWSVNFRSLRLNTLLHRRILDGRCVSIEPGNQSEPRLCLADIFAVNIRYTLGSCLFNFNNSSNTTNAITKAIPQCVDSCSKISDSIETNLANPTNATTYDYCSQPDFMLNVDACASCYNVVQNQRYLSNCKPTRSSTLSDVLTKV